MKTALISVYDKRGVAELAAKLVQLKFSILSSGGTAKILREQGIPVQDVSEYTGFPELFGGRVKTLHPKIHAGILARNSKEDLKILKEQGILPIDLVVVNLYPFEQTPTIENIDIGGPTLLRAAAKNFERVTVVSDPADYDRVASALEAGDVPLALRKELASKVFQKMVGYEIAIAGSLASPNLRYGENPHQQAQFFPGDQPFWGPPLQGKELSYNNIVDADAGWKLIREFAKEPFACAIIKHTNPCGVAVSTNSLVDAFNKALACDPSSAFGGIVAFNREVDGATAEELSKIFLEIVMAPAFSKEGLAIFSKKKNLRLLETREAKNLPQQIKSAGGGLLVQDDPFVAEDEAKWEVKTERKPTKEEWQALRFAWKIVKHVTSNAIVLATRDRLLGAGAGQTSRIDSIKIARMKMLGEGSPLVCASDAFLPFADNIEAMLEAKATAIIQPGGSIKDEEVISAANRHNLAMVFTGRRYFRH